MAKRGKTHAEALSKVDRDREYEPVDAIKLLKNLPGPKFNESVEVHIRTGLNVRHADEQLRGTLMLPHGTGREQRVAVFAEGDKAREAEEAGADVVGSADLAKRIVREIKDGKLKVQVAIQGDELRVTGKKRDDLQTAIQLVRGLKIEQPLQYVNFRD